MKTKYILILVFLCLTLKTKAIEKTYLDTVKISIDNKVFISIATFYYRDLINDSAIFEDVAILQANISKIKSEIPEYKVYKIEYIPGKSMVIKEGENKKSYHVNKGVIEPYLFLNECVVTGNDYIMTINFLGIDDLIMCDLKAKLEQSFQQMPKKNKMATTYNYTFSDNKLSHLKELDKKNGAKDVLVLEVGIGAGMVKNQLFNNISFTLGVILPKNGMWKHNWYTSGRAFVTFDANNDLKKNSILNLGYRVNTSKELNHQNWMGFEIGRLIRNEGRLFDKDTYVLGTIKEFGKLTLTTEFYFSDKFSKIYPGLRIEFKL